LSQGDRGQYDEQLTGRASTLGNVLSKSLCSLCC